MVALSVIAWKSLDDQLVKVHFYLNKTSTTILLPVLFTWVNERCSNTRLQSQLFCGWMTESFIAKIMFLSLSSLCRKRLVNESFVIECPKWLNAEFVVAAFVGVKNSKRRLCASDWEHTEMRLSSGKTDESFHSSLCWILLVCVVSWEIARCELVQVIDSWALEDTITYEICLDFHRVSVDVLCRIFF